MLLRPAEPDDAIAVARVHIRSWQSAYRTLLPDDFLDRLRPEERAASYDFATLDVRKPRTWRSKKGRSSDRYDVAIARTGWRGLQPAGSRLDSILLSTPAEHVGMTADAAGKSACATSTVTQICEAH